MPNIDCTDLQNIRFGVFKCPFKSFNDSKIVNICVSECYFCFIAISIKYFNMFLVKAIYLYIKLNSFSIIETTDSIVFVRHTSYICFLDIEDLT